MPTVFRKDGFEFRIYFDDHIPAHVHVFKAGGEAKIDLGSEHKAPELVAVYDMTIKDAKRALEIVLEHCADLLKRWEEIHGRAES